MEHPHVAYAILCEELARASMGFAAAVCMHASTATHGLYAWGSEPLRQCYLVPAIRGEMAGMHLIVARQLGLSS